ncbi:MAG: hypothetical protein JEZ14_10115 [Marinilabiliaceae bacterium]|nr:hypothetical protein [Marinilabiliaceae bacterium]
MLKYIILFLFLPLSIYSQAPLDDILRNLDHLIENRQQFTSDREQQINTLRDLKEQSGSTVERYQFAKQLHSVFLPYNIDSAMYYATSCVELADQMGQSALKSDARLRLVQSYLLAGMYQEAGELLADLESRELKPELKQFYYSMQHTRYRYLQAYLSGSALINHYDTQALAYQDSLLTLLHPSDGEYPVAQAERFRDEGRIKESKKLLFDVLERLETEDRSFAYTAYTLASVYQKEQDTLNQMKYLALSAESDIRNAVRENAAIRELALLRYQTGDIDRAYNYIKIALDDALFSNARLRSFEILQILPVIDQAYLTMREQKRQNMVYFTWIAIVLSVFLLLSLFFNQRQKRKLRWANDEIQSKNHQLEEANKQLHERHDQMAQANTQLTSSNQLQEEYIGRYLKLCSSYIGKMDHYRQTIHKKAAMGSKEDLLKLLKSKDLIDRELQSFYADFDQAFLDLYPGFVTQFNTLLKAEEQIELRPNEKLNTELRIFALIRLGITESPQIATFLRYSVTTIYNYRTKVRNKARISRDRFEEEVMKLGN